MANAEKEGRFETNSALKENALKYVFMAVYALSIVAANWLIKNVGIPIPGGSHLIPIGLGLMAPSGTLAAAVTLVSRDLVQRTAGRKWGLAVIAVGVGLTALLDPRLALASGAAFAFSELVEFSVYTPLQARGFVLAVVASALIGNVVDSVIFLTLAGIPLAVALAGLLVAKAYVILVATFLIALARKHIPVAATA